mgnify:CR=1 FL=1
MNLGCCWLSCELGHSEFFIPYGCSRKQCIIIMKLSFLLYLVPSSVIRGPGEPMYLGRFQTHTFCLLVSGEGAWCSTQGSLLGVDCYPDSRNALERRHLSKGRGRLLFSGQHFRVQMALTLGLL